MPAPRPNRVVLALAAAFCLPQSVLGQTAATSTSSVASTDPVPVKSLGVVTITGSAQPTSLPTQIPATMEAVTREQLERTVNATDSEDALKYLPSLLVRKRYIGDYNHAILSSRASGTGNSARSAVYADGMLLSNYLGNGVGGLSFPPRWGMVTPEEIERVDVMYGPFSAAYPGNSVGAVVVYTTRMPKGLEIHAKAGYTSQPFSLYNTDATYHAWETSASVGSREGAFAWLVNVHQVESHGQPLTFATRLVSNGTVSTAGTAVTGAVLDANNANAPWYVLGTGTEYRTQQDHFKAKFSYDITPTVRANYALGAWLNTSHRPAGVVPAQCRWTAGLQRPDQHRRPLLHRRSGPGGRRLCAHRREPDAPDARPHAEEPHARDLGLGGRREPLRLPHRSQAPECGRQPAAWCRRWGRRHGGRRQRHGLDQPRNQGHLAALWHPGGAHHRLRESSRTATSSPTSPPPSPATGRPTRPVRR